jgi:hypothetical protein
MHDDLKYLDLYDAAFQEQHLDLEDPDDLEGGGNHVYLGAKQKPCTLKVLGDNHVNDIAFANFRVHLARFLNSSLKQEMLPNGRRLVLQRQDTVSVFIPLVLIEA